jgi:hypothetical protein
MVWAFLIAVVLVSPFAYVTFRRLRAERRAETGHPVGAATDLEQDDEAGNPDGERDARRVVADVRAAALAHEPGERFEVTIPADTTIGGRAADRALVVLLVVDDLRRSGIEVEDPGAATTLRCRIP